MTLPFDTCRCMTPCALAAQCRRTEPGREWMQPMSVYPGGPDCCGLIKRERSQHVSQHSRFGSVPFREPKRSKPVDQNAAP